MKCMAIVLIAAVTANCFVKTVNGKPAIDTLRVPHIDALLPPYEDVSDSNNKDAMAKINATTTIAKTTTSTTTMKNSIANTESNNLTELSVEPFLPPLFAAKIEKEETTSTERLTTTTERPTTTTITPTTTTGKPATISTTLQAYNIKVPNKLLEPPSFDDVKEDKVSIESILTATSQKPLPVTTEFYHRQAQQQPQNQNVAMHNNNSQQQQKQILQRGYKVENYNNRLAANDIKVVESQTHAKQVSLASPKQNIKIATLTKQYDAKLVATKSKLKYDKNQYNYNFDFYLGATTRRPAKYGLPTITPFPHRLGR